MPCHAMPCNKNISSSLPGKHTQQLPMIQQCLRYVSRSYPGIQVGLGHRRCRRYRMVYVSMIICKIWAWISPAASKLQSQIPPVEKKSSVRAQQQVILTHGTLILPEHIVPYMYSIHKGRNDNIFSSLYHTGKLWPTAEQKSRLHHEQEQELTNTCNRDASFAPMITAASESLACVLNTFWWKTHTHIERQTDRQTDTEREIEK